MTKLHHMPHQAMVSENYQPSQILRKTHWSIWKRSALANIKEDALKYMINRLWYGIFHITYHINPRHILDLGPWANMGVSGWYDMWYEKWHIIIYNYYMAEGLRAYMSRGLIRHVLGKMPYHSLIYHILQCVFLNICEGW